jgi:HlyD family secretion protein
LLAAAIAVVLAAAAFVAWRALLRPLTVEAAPLRSDVREQVFGLGVTGARVQSAVGFKVAGVLVALDADEGDRIRAGQVLARLESRDVQAQVAVAKAAVVQARESIAKAQADVLSTSASLTNARQISERDAGLLDTGVVSQEQAQTDKAAVRIASANRAVAQSEVAVAQAALRSAEAQERYEEATLAQYTLRAPYDGWVVARNLELGSMPNPGQPVFTLVEAHSIWAVGYVDERLAGRLRVDQPAQIILRSDPGRPLPGHVARIEIQSDSVNEERIVDVAFDRTPANIHLAEQAEVEITTGTLPRAVLVPPVAISGLHDGRGTVWTVEHGRLERRTLDFGPQLLDGAMPVVGGLPAGAAVVAKSVSGLRAGRAVRIGGEAMP